MYRNMLMRSSATRRWLLIILILISSLAVSPSARPSYSAPEVPTITPDLSSFPLSFIANEGQMDADVRFQVQAVGGSLFFLPNEIALALPSAAPDGEGETQHTVYLRFDGASTAAVTGGQRQPGVVNYLIGNDPTQWHTNVPTYAGIDYQQLYSGIDLHYDGTNGMLKGTYTVAPHIDPKIIRWRYDGANRVQVDPSSGDLWIFLSDAAHADSVKLIERAPIAWQTIFGQQIPVDVRYTTHADGSIGFALGSYNPDYALVLDPTIQFSTFFGGGGTDVGYAITVDTSGNIYFVGQSSSVNLPKQNPWQGTIGGNADAFVTKMNIGTRSLVYSTYLGGNQFDAAYGLVIDSAGNAYVSGETASSNFYTESAYQATYGGGGDSFITKLNPSGSDVLFSTFLGGSGYESRSDVAVDSTGAVYVTGDTTSSDFPGTSNSNAGGTDAYVAKLAANGASIVYASYLGGSSLDTAASIVIDTSNNAYIAGRTTSSNFPVQSAYDAVFQGDSEGFVAKIGPTGARVFVTYVGGSASDSVSGIAIKGSYLYLTGETTSAGLAVNASQAQATIGGLEDAFIAKIPTAGTSLSFFTYWGGSADDNGISIALDAAGVMYITGRTFSGNFPVASAFQASYAGSQDAFVVAINASYTIAYSSYLGGMGEDEGLGIAVDAGGSAYVTGSTLSGNDFPVTTGTGTYQYGGGMDAFITLIGTREVNLSISKVDNPHIVEVGDTVVYTVVVSNLSSDNSGPVVMRDPLPVEMTYLSHSTAHSSTTCAYDTPTHTITCNITDLLPLNQDPVTITIAVQVATGGIIYNEATVMGSMFDPNPGNNRAATYTTASGVADLGVTKTVSSYRPKQDEVITYTVQITNYGTSMATGVELVDILPTGLSNITWTSKIGNDSGGSYDPSSGLWTVGNIPYPGTATLTIQAKVSTGVGVKLINTITSLTSNQADPNSSNNSATVQSTVMPIGSPIGCYPLSNAPGMIVCFSN